MTIKPQGNRILVELIPYDLEKDGILIPSSHKEETQTARVIEIGTGTMSEYGVILPSVEVGDIVLTSQLAGTMITDGEHKYQLVSHDKLEGVIG